MSEKSAPMAVENHGWCMICDSEITDDVQTHFDKEHPAPKQLVVDDMISWQERIDQVIEALQDIKEGTDRRQQVQDLDRKVIQELYVVRARLAQDIRGSK